MWDKRILLALALLCGLTAGPPPADAISTISRYKTFSREVLTFAALNAWQDHTNSKINELVAIHPGDSTLSAVVRTDTLRSYNQTALYVQDPLRGLADADSLVFNNARFDSTKITSYLNLPAGGTLYAAHARIDTAALDSLTVIGPVTVSGAGDFALTTQATSATAGAVTMAGGLAVAKRVWADALGADGGYLYLDGYTGNNLLGLESTHLNVYVGGELSLRQLDGGAVQVGTKESGGSDWSSDASLDEDLEVAELGGSPILRLAYRSDDTTPQVADTDELGAIQWWGWDNNLTPGGQNVAAQIKAIANGTWTSDAQGTADLVFLVSAVEALRLESGGEVGINETDPAATLDVYDNTARSTPGLEVHLDNASNTASAAVKITNDKTGGALLDLNADGISVVIAGGGTASATAAGWIAVTVNGETQYLRTYSTK